jgi:hypothetical protein
LSKVGKFPIRVTVYFYRSTGVSEVPSRVIFSAIILSAVGASV